MSNISLIEINHIYSNSNKKPEKFISYPLRKKNTDNKTYIDNCVNIVNMHPHYFNQKIFLTL